MVKQICCGSRGRLAPSLAALASCLIYFSLIYTSIHADKDSWLLFLAVTAVFITVLRIIYRYFFVTLEYLFIGGDFVVRVRRRDAYSIKASIPASDLVGYWAPGEMVPAAFKVLPSRNRCATVRGLFKRRATLVYKTSDASLRRLVFEPSAALSEALQKDLNRKLCFEKAPIL